MKFETSIVAVVVVLTLMTMCSRETFKDEDATTKTSTLPTLEILPTNTIGVEGQEPDLYIPEYETGWKFWNAYGIRANAEQWLSITDRFADSSWAEAFHIPVGSSVRSIGYNCPIGNKAPIDTTGKNDFVVCRSCDGIYNTYYGSYDFPGMLAIELFKDGLPVSSGVKNNFFVSNTDMTEEFYNSLRQGYKFRNYGADTMWIGAGRGDIYTNWIPVEGNGKFVLVAIINPDGVIHERDNENNAGSLPLNIVDYNGSYDITALETNKTKPATNFNAKFSGKDKTITLTWSCPYDAKPVYHYAVIKKDDIIIADDFYGHTFTEKVSNNQKHTYSITIDVLGLGESIPVTTKN